MRVLMIGPSRVVKGGISTLVNNYYAAELDKKVSMTYLRTMEDGNKLKKLLIAIASFFSFLFIIRKHDILHVHMSTGASFYRKSFFIISAKRLSKKIIIHLHGGEFHLFYNQRSSLRQRAFIRYIYQCADGVIVLSESWKEFLSTFVDSSKITVIYNCVPVPADADKNYSNYQLLFMGRINNTKGIYDLIDIMPDIKDQFPEVRLSIGGDGEIRQLQKIIHEKKLEEQVKYIGWVTDTAKEEYFRRATIYLLPSYNECLPMGLLEAMSYKCASVTTTVGGIPEVIKQDQNGYMFEPGDKNRMKEIIIMLLKDSKTCERIGRRAYSDIIETYNCHKSVEKLLGLYYVFKGETDHEYSDYKKSQ